jgi:hypothetical protein
MLKDPIINSFCRDPGDGFFKKGVGDPNPFTVSQMPFFWDSFSKKLVFFAFFYRILVKRAPWPPEAKLTGSKINSVLDSMGTTPKQLILKKKRPT